MCDKMKTNINLENLFVFILPHIFYAHGRPKELCQQSWWMPGSRVED